MFELSWEASSSLFVARISGFWRLADLDAYERDALRFLEGHRAKVFDALIDRRAAPVQAADVTARLGATATVFAGRGMRNVAMLVSAPLIRPQPHRGRPSSHSIFGEEAAAREWLGDARARDLAARAAIRHPVSPFRSIAMHDFRNAAHLLQAGWASATGRLTSRG